MNRQGLRYDLREYEDFKKDMIERLKKAIPEYSDFSDSDFGMVLIDLVAHGLDVLSYYNEKVANEAYLETAEERESIVKIAKMLGYTLEEATPSQVYEVFEITPKSKDFTIPKGYEVRTVPNEIEDAIVFETVEDLVIPAGATGLEKDSEDNYLYKVLMKQGYTVNNEILGTSNDSPNQSFMLNYSPVIKDSIVVNIDDGLGSVEWTRVDSFINSKSNSKHYIVELDEERKATIKFGNGISGMIPNSLEDGMRVTYRVGGGKIGNVGTNTITYMPSKLADIKRAFNPEEPFILGKDSEDIETARVNIPYSLSSKWGLVTLKDYEALALSTDGVIRASALESKANLTADLILVTEEGKFSSIKNKLTIEINQKKMLGTKFNIVEADEVEHDLYIKLKMYSKYDQTETQDKVRDLIGSLFTKGKYNIGEAPDPSDFIVDILSLEEIRGVSIDFTNSPVIKETSIAVCGTVNVDVQKV